MKNLVVFSVFKRNDLYVWESKDIPIHAKGATLDILAKALKESVALYFDDNDFQELGFDEYPNIELKVEIQPKYK